MPSQAGIHTATNIAYSASGPSTSMVISTVDLQHSLVENRTKAISIFMGFYFSFKIYFIHKPYTALQKKKKKDILCIDKIKQNIMYVHCGFCSSKLKGGESFPLPAP